MHSLCYQKKSTRPEPQNRFQTKPKLQKYHNGNNVINKTPTVNYTKIKKANDSLTSSVLAIILTMLL